jgi:hypothetical protein
VHVSHTGRLTPLLATPDYTPTAMRGYAR